MDATIWNREAVEDAVSKSISYSECIKRITGAPKRNSHQWRVLMRFIEEFKIDTSHFPKFSRRISEGTKRNRTRIPDEKLFVVDPSYNHETLRRRFFELNGPNGCVLCGIKDWNGKPLSLQLDHISGVKTDWRPENLRWLCPNCHSQTPTYCRGANHGKAIEIPLDELAQRVEDTCMRTVARELGVEPATIKRTLFYGGYIEFA